MREGAGFLRKGTLSILVLVAAGVVFVLAALDFGGGLNPSSPSVSLAAVENYVEKKFPVRNLSAAEFVERRRNRKIVLLDVRENEEFEISHIAGAIRVNPNETVQGFMTKLANELRGAEVVFYCSVGVRSSRFLQEMEPALRKLGVEHAYNLRGGIFRWHIEERPVYRGSLQAQSVHPFDEAWGKLLERSLKREKGDS